MTDRNDRNPMAPEDNPQWWVLHAACVPDSGPPVPVDELFVDSGRSISEDTLKVCAACPVRADCLAWAYQEDIRAGYFGGVSHGVRKRYTLEQVLAALQRDGGAALR